MEISKIQFMDLDFDTNVEHKKQDHLAATVLIVFKHADINAAAYYLVKSIQGQLEHQQVATICIQESIYKDFLEITQTLLEQSNVHIPTTKSTQQRKVTIPCLIPDVTHEHLESPWFKSGLITMHVFRTAKEAVSLVLKETIVFENVSIWHENHAHVYELITVLKNQKYFINCCNAPKELFAATAKENVAIKHNYHVEILELAGVRKTIVFPIGCTFAN